MPLVQRKVSRDHNVVADGPAVAIAKADAGDANAQLHVAVRRYYGLGMPQDYGQAAHYFELAARQGDLRAQVDLGRLYEEGLGVARDLQQALHWYQAAAAQDSPQAHVLLAELYDEERSDGAADPPAALRHWSRAAELGSQRAAAVLELLTRSRTSVQEDMEGALDGDADCQYRIGVRYRTGDGFERDVDTALLWLTRASEQEHAGASYELAGMLREGEADLPKGNAQQAARELLIRAAEKGHPAAREELGLPPAARAPEDTGEPDPFVQLESLIGLRNVKAEVLKLKGFAWRQSRLAADQKKAPSLHMVFLGPPGTGKTTVARIIGSMLRRLGLLKKGHVVEVDRSGLVGPFIGQTERKTQEVIDSALDGVLFIDEAYALASDESDAKDYGRQAADAVLKAMEDHRERLCVIAAGYTQQMRDFLDSNPGFQSRFSRHVVFGDYTDDELVQIFDVMIDGRGMSYEDGVLPLVRAYLTRERNEATPGAFGNARTVRNLVDLAIEHQATRLMGSENTDAKGLMRLTAEDFAFAREEAVNVEVGDDDEDPLAELQKLVGLEAVKAEVEAIGAAAWRAQQLREAGERPPEHALHMVFRGSPGTGKTTVARIIGRVLKRFGRLSKGHVVEVDRSGLVGSVMGETEKKTAKVVRRALGGVLFIDEAYALATRGGSDQYGASARNTLLKLMDDYRDRLCVIIAGYPQPMDAFLQTNPGFRSRFPKHIGFADYTGEELAQIFRFMLEARNMTCDDGAPSIVDAMLAKQRAEAPEGSFGNARAVRNLLERAEQRQALRLMKKPSATREELLHLKDEDFGFS